jgi:hypothetical protein
MQMKNAYKILLGKGNWIEPLGRPGCGWKDSIKMELEEADSIHLTQDRNQWWGVVNMALNPWVP